MSRLNIQTEALMALLYAPTAAPFEGLDTKQNTIPSIMPRIFDRVLDLLVSGAREHKGLVTAFAPAATNYLMTAEDAFLSQAIRNTVVDHARSLKAKGVKIIMTDLLGDSRWAAIPLINGPTALLQSSVYTGQEHPWNHKEKPTIYVSTIDVILSEATESEMSHVLLKAFAMSIHELAHLLPRFVSRASKMECVELSITVVFYCHESDARDNACVYILICAARTGRRRRVCRGNCTRRDVYTSYSFYSIQV